MGYYFLETLQRLLLIEEVGVSIREGTIIFRELQRGLISEEGSYY
jgi:hypothetical protein